MLKTRKISLIYLAFFERNIKFISIYYFDCEALFEIIKIKFQAA